MINNRTHNTGMISKETQLDVILSEALPLFLRSDFHSMHFARCSRNFHPRKILRHDLFPSKPFN